MSISGELKELEAMLQNGTLTQEEFQIAKQRVLEAGSAELPTVDLRDFKIQNEIAQLDREWTLEREKYMISGRYGHRSLPEPTSGNTFQSAFAAVFIVGFGVFWTIMAASITSHSNSGPAILFPLFGVGFVVLCLTSFAQNRKKSVEYEAAQRRYQERRNVLIEQQGR